MKTFKVEMLREVTSHASTLIEANSEKEAIALARKLEPSEWDKVADSSQTLWGVDTKRSFVDVILSFFRGDAK